MKYTYVLGICAQQQRLSCMGDPFHQFAWWPNHHQSFVRQGFWHLLESKQFLHHLIMFLFEYFQVYNFFTNYFFIRTFPWRPATPFFLKYPLPRPPAKTWAFTTQSGVGSFFAISNASSAEWATWPSGVFTPYSFEKINYGISIQIMNLPWGGQMRDIRELKDFFGKCLQLPDEIHPTFSQI